MGEAAKGQAERKGRYGRIGTIMRKDSAGKCVNERYLYGNKQTFFSRLGSAETGSTIQRGINPRNCILAAKLAASLTCLLLECIGIRSSCSAVWRRKCGSSTRTLLASPNQIWGGGFQKPFWTWNAHRQPDGGMLGSQKDWKRKTGRTPKTGIAARHTLFMYTNGSAILFDSCTHRLAQPSLQFCTYTIRGGVFLLLLGLGGTLPKSAQRISHMHIGKGWYKKKQTLQVIGQSANHLKS